MKISVLMITYNQAQFIAQAMDSVLMQRTDFEMEIVVSDDNSTDGTRNIVREYAEKFPGKIRALLNEKNSGAHANFQIAYNACRGEYIALLEGDDYWTDSAKLQKQVAFLEAHPEFSISSHNVVVHHEDNSSPDVEWLSADHEEVITLEDLLRKGSGGATCSLVFRRGVFGAFPAWYTQLQGGDWTLQILCASHGNMRYFREPMAVYRRGIGGMTAVAPGSQKEIDIFLAGGVRICETLDSHFAYKYHHVLGENLHKYFYPNLFRIYERNGQTGIARAYAQKIVMGLAPSGDLDVNRLVPLLGVFGYQEQKEIEDFLRGLIDYSRKSSVDWNAFATILSKIKAEASTGSLLFIGPSTSGVPEVLLRETAAAKLFCFETLNDELSSLPELGALANDQLAASGNRCEQIESILPAHTGQVSMVFAISNDVASIRDIVVGAMTQSSHEALTVCMLSNDEQNLALFGDELEERWTVVADDSSAGILHLTFDMTANRRSCTRGMELSMEMSPAWAESYLVTEFLIRKFRCKRGAEVGVARGHHTAHLLERFPRLQWTAIDPWKHFDIGYDDPANASQEVFDRTYESVTELLHPYAERLRIVRKTSLEAMGDVENNLDFIFVDANHSYEGVKEDITAWWDKVIPGGIVAGHDYGHVNFPGVSKAVDEVLSSKGLKPNVEAGTVWWVQKPLDVELSVIIPCYNCATTVRDSIESIYAQKLDIVFEIICTDDCSTDETLRVLRHYEKKYRNFRVIRHDVNKGGAAARNTCVRYSRADLIFCLDSDNILEPGSLTKLVRHLKESGCEAASFASLQYFSTDVEHPLHSWTFSAPNNVCDLAHIISNIQTPAASGNYLFTRSSWERAGGYPEGRGAMDAWGFGFRQHATGTSIAILPDSFYWHRLSDNSYWTRENRQNRNDLNAVMVVREKIDLFDGATQALLLSAGAESTFFQLIEQKRLHLKRSGASANRRKDDLLKVHIGCGPRILKGWVNIDLAFEPFENYLKYYTDEFYGPNVRGTKEEFIAMNVAADRLPFEDNSVDVIFNEDFIEHIDQREQILFLAETFRVLKPGGVHRVTTPNLKWIMDHNCNFSEGRNGVNDECWHAWGHKDMLTPEMLKSIASMVGFDVTIQDRRKTLAKDLPKEYRPDPKAGYGNETHLFADLVKPDGSVRQQPSQITYRNRNRSQSHIKLHLGCGERYLDGYINIDYPPSEHSVQRNTRVDEYADITALDCEPGTVDEVRLHHVFEHFDRVKALTQLIRWHEWLSPLGMLTIETPDIEASWRLLSDASVSYADKQAVLRHVFGSQEAHWAVHYDGWYKEKYEYVLTAFGFSDITVELTEWKQTRNILVRARKVDELSRDELLASAKQILRDSLIDDSPSELRMLDVWCGQLNANFHLTSVVQAPKAPASVGIFIPVYNREKYLAATLDSLLLQTFRDFEVVIADDGSSDDSVAIANEYARRDSRISVIELQHGGEVAARNEALQRFGPHIKYLMNHDSDDLSMPEKIETLVRYLEMNPDIAIVGCKAVYFDDEGKNLGMPGIETDPEMIRTTFADVNSMINSAALIRREVFEKIGLYRDEFRSVDDYDFFARALCAGYQLANVDQTLHAIRLHPQSIGTQRQELQRTLEKKIRQYYRETMCAPRPMQGPVSIMKRKPLKILNTVEFYAPHVGGAESVVQVISEGLAARGHEVAVATTKLAERSFSTLNGVTIRSFDVNGRMASGFGGSDVGAYRDFVLKTDFDVVFNYAAQQWATDLAFESTLKNSDCRVNVLAPCGYSALKDSKTLQWPQFASYFNEVLPNVLPRYDAVVYHSASYKDYQYAKDRKFPNGIVIPNGADESEFERAAAFDFRKKHQIKSKYVGLCVANYYEGKGQDRLIECVRQMKREDFELVLIGKEGKELKRLRMLANGLPVHFFVDIPRDETLAAFRSADVFLFGSHVEAFPLVILEAKASGVPFVSTDCGNVKELRGGVVCDVREFPIEVGKLLNDESYRKALGAEGKKEWKERFTWNAVIDQYERLFELLAESKRGKN